MRDSRPLLAVLERLAAYHEARGRGPCERAGVDPLTHTPSPVCERRGVDPDCTYCGVAGVIETPF